ncbi:MAG: hypothetical protein ACI846_000148 [Pseudoalteromonas distincta]|jgi:hypothetical protein
MIHKINNTKELNDTYFEDIDALVSSQDEAYLINTFYFFYYSTLESAKKKARSIGISENVSK